MRKFEEQELEFRQKLEKMELEIRKGCQENQEQRVSSIYKELEDSHIDKIKKQREEFNS